MSEGSVTLVPVSKAELDSKLEWLEDRNMLIKNGMTMLDMSFDQAAKRAREIMEDTEAKVAVIRRLEEGLADYLKAAWGLTEAEIVPLLIELVRAVDDRLVALLQEKAAAETS
jgi:hypothetical protein